MRLISPKMFDQLNRVFENLTPAPPSARRLKRLEKIRAERDRINNILFIESLYPADSATTNIANIGKTLLASARATHGSDWRTESDDVIAEYAALCLLRQKTQENVRLTDFDFNELHK